MAKRQIGQKTNFPKDKLAKRQIFQKTNWPKDKLAKSQISQSTNWPKGLSDLIKFKVANLKIAQNTILLMCKKAKIHISSFINGPIYKLAKTQISQSIYKLAKTQIYPN